MWRIVNHGSPDDYVLATGECHSVREFVELAFKEVDIDIIWHGRGVGETGHDAATGAVRVKIDPRYFRPTEVDLLIGDASKAREILGWVPTTTFRDVVTEMVQADLKTVLEGTPSGQRAWLTWTFHSRARGYSSPATAGWWDRLSHGHCGERGCDVLTAPRPGVDLRRQAEVECWMQSRTTRRGVSRCGPRRRDPGQQHTARGVHPRQSGDSDSGYRGRSPGRYRQAAVPGFELHLSEDGATAHRGRTRC